MKLTYFFQMYNSMFHMQDHTKKIDTLWVMLQNDWKCIFNCVSLSESIILNFSALCDALYGLQKIYRATQM